jgi:DNA-binding LacI/PurR family transcriptional regulator
MRNEEGAQTGSSPKRPTLQDVANAANVSVMTVSRALKGSPAVTRKTRDRVLAEAARMGYRPSFSARTLRTGESRLISIVALNIAVPLHIEVLQGARDAAAQHDYRLMLHMDSPNRAVEYAFSADGDLIMGEGMRVHSDISRSVSLIEPASDGIDLCGTDLPGITRDTFLYLHAAGYRRIGFIQSKDNTPKKGWLEAISQLAIDVDPNLIQEVGPGRQGIVAGVRRLTSQHPRPDAIVVVHTAGTPIVLEELQREGFTIGRDIGFVGSEVSNNEWGNVVSPGLTMIRLPGYAIGWSGCTRLIERLRGDDSPPKHIQFPSELVIRQSTPRIEHPD